MIKEMFRLSCSVCDNFDDQSIEGPKRRPRFRNVEQLKGHLFHQHKTLMCSLCLKGRKVFICEQKLYTRAQLNQHIQTGDSEVDGTERERGGFMGHPICKFCKTPLYGDNELYSHMTTEHYTCHICQRQRPGQFDYYKNYDNLENHFRRAHFLCEDEACLANKFTVFVSEFELMRQNAGTHGGNMSRSKRNAVLQISINFQFQRGIEQSNHRGRASTFRRDYSEDQIPSEYEASFGTSTDSSSNMVAGSSLNSSSASLAVSSFPPLPAAQKRPSASHSLLVSASSSRRSINAKASSYCAKVSSKDGNRISKGKGKKMLTQPLVETSLPSCQTPVVGGSNPNLKDSGGKGGKQKKIPKFLRTRLGSAAALIDLKDLDLDPDPDLNSVRAASHTNPT